MEFLTGTGVTYSPIGVRSQGWTGPAAEKDQRVAVRPGGDPLRRADPQRTAAASGARPGCEAAWPFRPPRPIAFGRETGSLARRPREQENVDLCLGAPPARRPIQSTTRLRPSCQRTRRILCPTCFPVTGSSRKPP